MEELLVENCYISKPHNIHLSLILYSMEPEEEVKVCQLPVRRRGQYSRDRFRNIEITTNFYPVSIKPIECIYIFRVKITPQIMDDDRGARKRLLEQAMPKIKLKISSPVMSGFNIYSVSKPVQEQITVAVEEYQIDIKLVKSLSVAENSKVLVHFLNNGLRNLMSRHNYVEIGRTGRYFNAKKKQTIDNLMMFSGYKANFMELEKGIYFRIDTAKKIVRNQSVLQAINEIYKLHNEKDRDEKRNLLREALINKIIMTNYGKTRYVKITDIEFQDVDSTFIPEENISIRQYFDQKYKIKIQNPRQPLLIVESSKKKEQKTYMVPELCLMTGIPDDFDQRRRKKISEATIKSAEERRREIHGLMNEIKDEASSLKEIGITIERNMEKLRTKQIPPPRLMLGNNEKVEEGREPSFQLFSQPIFANKHALKAGIIYFRSSDVSEMLNIFQDTSRRLKIEFKPVKINAGDFDYKRAISIIDECVYKATEKQSCNICLILIPNQLKTQYKKIKEKCLLHNKIICQIATENTLRNKKFKAIATKILLQMIAKRGNTLWVPHTEMKHEKIMLAGFESSKSNGKNLLAGVATINSTYSSICSKVEEYRDNSDKMHAMMTVLIKLVDLYVHRNKEPPKQILIFSNSCSNDLLNLYQEYMISPVLEKFDEIYKQKKPCLSMVLVNTKTSERFFQMQGDSAKNVPAGTVISESIVSKNYDFFMVSQFSHRGTTVPNHYKVIYSDSKMEEGVLQELIYSQCFNYVNWTGSIKVPGILQYAKKCVKFNAEVLETRKICEELENKLYFI